MAIVTAAAPLPAHPTAAPSFEKQAPKMSPVQGVPATEAAPVADIPDELMSPKFAALARQQKELRQLQKNIQAEKAALAAKEDDYKTNYVPKSRFKEDLMGLLMENGIDYDQLTELALNQPAPQDRALSKLQKEIQDLRTSQEDAKKQAADSETKKYEQAVNQIRNEAKILIDSDENFDTIKQTGSEEAVVELIKDTFEKQGTLLTVQQAAEKVEKYLVDEALKMASFKKIKEKLTPVEQLAANVAAQSPKQSAPLPTQAQTPQQPIKTLTNAQSATSNRPLSNKERRERAIAAFRGQPLV